MFLLKEEKQYRRLFLAGVVNGVGDRFSQVAMLAMLLQMTGSGLEVGITMALRLLPFLIFGPIGGWLADKVSQKKILVMTDLGRILFALSFLFVENKGDVWIIYVSSFVLAIGEALYAPARKSMIPQLVNKNHLLNVNSMEQVMVGIVLIGGAVSGGIISSLFGPYMTFWFNGLSFLFAALLIISIDIPERQNHEDSRQQHTPFRFLQLKRLLQYSIPLQVIFLCEILISSLNGIDNVLISVYAVDVFHLGELGVGLFYGALGVGLMISFTVAKKLSRNILLVGLTCLMLEGALLVSLSQTQTVVFALITFCSVAFMSGIGNACFDTVLMNEIPKEHRGKIFGISATVSNSLLGVSMFLAGTALEYIDPRWLGMMGGGSFVIIAILLMLVYTSKRSRVRIKEYDEASVENID